MRNASGDSQLIPPLGLRLFLRLEVYGQRQLRRLRRIGTGAPNVVPEYESVAALIFGVADFVEAAFNNSEFEVAELAGLGAARDGAGNKNIIWATNWRHADDVPDERLLVTRVLMKLPLQHGRQSSQTIQP